MSLRREALSLVGVVVVVDAVFVAAYLIVGVARVSNGSKLLYAGVWTAVTLAVVLRGLTRIRRARLQGMGRKTS